MTPALPRHAAVRPVRPRLSVVWAALGAAALSCGAPAEYPGREAMFGSQEEDLTQCPGAHTLEGIDVSSWQGSISWAGVKGSGRVFAIARVSHGLAADATFAANWAGMKSAGLVRGSYQYFSPAEDAAAQADLVMQKIGSLGAGDLPLVLDVEETGGLSPAQLSAAVQVWVDRITAHYGRPPMIYSGAYFWNDYVKTTAFASLPLWLPAYGNNCPLLPSPWGSWLLHQYSSHGAVAGISGNVDLDLFNGTLADLTALAGLPLCTAKCDGSVAVGADCGRSDCAPAGGRCVSDTFGVRCISTLCPATGAAAVCSTETRVGHCQDGRLASTSACPDASYCSTAGTSATTATCVSAFCVPAASEPPAAHDGCYLRDDQIAHCDAKGALTVETCAGGQQCVSDGTVHCDKPLCPATGSALVCVDSNTLGHCSDGSIADTANCESLGGVCTTSGAHAHCASSACVDSPTATPSAHDLCLTDGRLGRCDEEGLLVGVDPCAPGTACVLTSGVATCAPVRSADGGVGPQPPETKGCGCGSAPTGGLALGLGALLRRRSRPRPT